MTIEITTDIYDDVGELFIPEGSVFQDCKPWRSDDGMMTGVQGNWSSRNGTVKMIAFKGEYKEI